MRNIVLALIFFILSEIFILKDGYFLWFFAPTFLFALIVSWYFIKKASIVTIVSLIPIIQFPLIYLVGGEQAEHFIALISSLAFYLLFNPKVKKSHLIIISFAQFILAVSILFTFHALYGIPYWLILPLVFLLSFSLFFSSSSAVLKLTFPLKLRLFYFSIILGIVMLEFYWLVSKLPFNFITAGFIVFLVYYTIWDITIRYFSGSLTKKSMYFVLSFLLLILAAIFITVKLLLM